MSVDINLFICMYIHIIHTHTYIYNLHFHILLPVSPSTTCVIVLISLVTEKNKYEINALMKIAYYTSLNIRYKTPVTKYNLLFF